VFIGKIQGRNKPEQQYLQFVKYWLVFVNSFTGRPYTEHITSIFGRTCKKALGYKIGMAKACRTSFEQQIANNGMEISMLSRWLRHSDSRVTKRYYEFKTSSMKSAVDKVRKSR
jgi:hypothetical protein